MKFARVKDQLRYEEQTRGWHGILQSTPCKSVNLKIGEKKKTPINAL